MRAGAERILLVQTAFLGDVVLTTPVIAAARAAHPTAELYVLTTPLAAPLLEGDPELAGVLQFAKRGARSGLGGMWRMARELREYRFARAYVLQGSLRTALLLWLARIPERIGFKDRAGSLLYTECRKQQKGGHAVERHLSLLCGEQPRAFWPDRMRLAAPSPEKLHPEVRAFLQSGAAYTVLMPGSAWATKQWNVDHFAELAALIARTGRTVVIGGAPQERSLADRIAARGTVHNFCGVGSVLDLAALIGSAQAVVCNDSAPLHIASAFGVPAVVLFFSTLPDFGFTPWRTDSIVLDATGLRCKPCGRHGRPSCPENTNACMNQVLPEAAFRALSVVSKWG